MFVPITKRIFLQFSVVPLIIHFRFGDELISYIVICCMPVSGGIRNQSTNYFAILTSAEPLLILYNTPINIYLRNKQIV